MAEAVKTIASISCPMPLPARDTVLLGHGSGGKLTTDSFVVKPLFFPGGEIGSLAVHGTVNDLAMGGAQPLFLSAAFIIEEGHTAPWLVPLPAAKSVAGCCLAW